MKKIIILDKNESMMDAEVGDFGAGSLEDARTLSEIASADVVGRLMSNGDIHVIKSRNSARGKTLTIEAFALRAVYGVV